MELPPNVGLHPKFGANFHPTYCMRCNEAGEQLTAIGDRNKIFKCKKCGLEYFCFEKAPPTCINQDCLSPLIKYVRDLEPDEAIPMHACTKCERRESLARPILMQGGIIVHCEKCGLRGAVQYDHPIAMKMRDMSKDKQDPGIVYSLPQGDCPVCTGVMRKGDGFFTIVDGRSKH